MQRYCLSHSNTVEWIYNVDGKIYFGEITFHHGGGCNGIEPKEWAYKMGDWITLD